MSRKRDTNWSRDEITVLLDSIIEITKKRATDDKKTNSREVFEYAAKKMAEKGHTSRAEREKCRTKWKKMKEEYTHAKRVREGDTRYKEAPGIQPFYDRMDEFINGGFNNISPHSTIVRRLSSLSSSVASSTSTSGMRTSARIAASTTNGSCQVSSDGSTNQSNNPNLSNNINNDISNNNSSNNTNHHPKNSSSTQSVSANAPGATLDKNRTNVNTTNNNTNINNRNISPTTNGIDYHPNLQPLQNASPISRQNFRLSSGSSTNAIQPTTTTATIPNNLNHQQQVFPNGDPVAIYSNYQSTSNASSSLLTGSVDPMQTTQSTEHADISYRVSTGCRQITIFGDHDVDIKFRGDCVTINKIDVDFALEN